MAVPPHVDRWTFLANLRQSGLLTDEQLAVVCPSLPDSERGRVLARDLVRRGLLTKFQAERLLAGLTQGFVLGQYLILDELGQGGMGRVFKAMHRTMSRTVALKVLAPHLLKTARAQDLFQREVRAVAQLMHANVVAAYDANQVGDRSYLVLEYVDGPNLEQLVRDSGPLPIGQACEFIRQAAMGLQYAHEQGMVHRDIKPANLLLQRGSGVVKVSDFGLARLHDPRLPEEGGVGTILTRQNVVLGTPDYLSPEQAKNLHNADIRSDLYSLGCTLYYLLTGTVPYPGGSTLEKIVRHHTEPTVPVEELRPEVPAAVASVVRRLMAKDPAERFQTPAQLALTLAPFAVGGPGEWAAARAVNAPSLGFDLITPAEPDQSSDPAMDEDSILVGTLPPGLSPTPLSGAGLASSTRLPLALEAEQRRRARLAVAVAVAIVGGLLAAAAAAAFLA